MTYPQEKFGNAVRVLATSPKSIQERVYLAFVEITAVELGDDPSLPIDVRAQLEKYHEQWQEFEPGVEGQMTAWVRTLSDDEAAGVANWFVVTESRLRDS